ncbi:MAG: hypothetical protein ACK5S6_03950 [bacterium]|jgi:hypothetical protein
MTDKDHAFNLGFVLNSLLNSLANMDETPADRFRTLTSCRRALEAYKADHPYAVVD